MQTYNFDFSRVTPAEWFVCGQLFATNTYEVILFLARKTITHSINWRELDLETANKIGWDFGMACGEYLKSFSAPAITNEDINSIFRRAVNGE